MIATGLVGFGNAGRTFHAPVIRAVEGLELKAIVQRSAKTGCSTPPSAMRF
jgi:predicted dehydrogenase